MTIQRICGLSLLLTAISLSGGCSSLKKQSDVQPADSGTTTSSSTAGADVALGAYDDPELSSQSLANVRKAAEAGLGAGYNIVRFGYDSDSLSTADMSLLRKHASFIKANPGVAVRLEGHTDERGTQEYNMALGERRAKAVAAFLQANGAPGSQLEVISYGELKPAAQGETEEAWSRNRRVEVVYR